MLTDSKIKAAKPTERAYKLSDSGGLYLHVQPSGAKYWRCKYRFLNKEKLLSFGTYPAFSLSDARAKRDDAKIQLKNGIDPALVKQRQKNRRYEAAANSFSAIAQEWLIKQNAVLAKETAKRKLAMLENDILPYIGKRPIAEIETFELVGCLNRIVDRGTVETAHKSRNIINQVCRYAKQTGRIKHNPASDLAGALPAKRKSHRPAIVDPQGFGRLLVAIDQYQGSMIVRTALALAPLLFQRPGELCAMEWAEIDIENGLWTIPIEKKKERNKVEGDHIVPLCHQAKALLEDIQPLTGRGRFVFPNQRNHESTIRTESLNKAIRACGFDTKTQHCAHGFRASARTMLAERLHLRIDWIAQQLAHQVRDTLGNAYNRTKYLPERIDMMQRWADYLDNLKRQVLAGNVIAASFNTV
ncbi:MAG: integrase [Paracoccaceae bacterium]|jgi:integrase